MGWVLVLGHLVNRLFPPFLLRRLLLFCQTGLLVSRRHPRSFLYTDARGTTYSLTILKFNSIIFNDIEFNEFNVALHSYSLVFNILMKICGEHLLIGPKHAEGFPLIESEQS